MSIEFNSKLNRGGLGGASFGANKGRTGVSSQATRNLGSSSSTTKSSYFSLSGRRPNGFVSGQHVTKGSNRASYSNQRASLNSRTYTPTSKNNTIFTSNASYAQALSNPYAQQSNGISSFMNSLNMGAQIGMETFNFLNNIGVFGKGDSETTTVSNSANLDNAMSSLTGSGSVNSSGVSGTISSMESCTDSASLRSAIADANGELSQMNAQTGSLQSDATKAEQSMDKFKDNVSTSKDNVKTAKNALGTATQTVKATEANRDNALNAVDKADSQYGSAVKSYTQAHDKHVDAKTKYASAQHATSSAQATLNSTPKTITDSSGNQVENPAYKEAEAQLEKAKQAEEQAKQVMDDAAAAEQEAEQAKQEAYNNLGDKKAAVDTAEKNLKDAQTKMDNAKTAEGKANDNLTDANQKYDQATNILESAQSAVEKLQVHQRNVTKLSAAIEKQNARLAKLEEKEQDKYDKYDNKAQKGIDKNNKRNASINYDDGVNTRSERRTASKMESTNEKVQSNLEKRNQYSENVNDTQWIKDTLMKKPADAVVGGEEFRSGTTPSGNTVYYRGNMPISEEEYKNATKAGM